MRWTWHVCLMFLQNKKKEKRPGQENLHTVNRNAGPRLPCHGPMHTTTWTVHRAMLTIFTAVDPGCMHRMRMPSTPILPPKQRSARAYTSAVLLLMA